MSPIISKEVAPQSEAKKSRSAETLVLEPCKTEQARINPTPQRKERAEEPPFRSSMLECNHMKSSSRPLDFFLALLLNTTILVGPVFAGLYFTDTIDLKKFETTFLIAPPPPPPPPPAPTGVVTKAAPVHRVFEHAGKLIAPIAVPQHIAEIKEAPIPEADLGGGVPGGVPGGVAGGSMGGVIGGVIGGVTTAVPAAPIAPEQVRPRAPIRVGGQIRPPKLLVQIQPEYPAIARQAHVQGVVTIDAILDEQGNVVEMKIVSGPPLLYQAALEALAKWKYEPVYLNDRPIPVELLVHVTFELKQH
jgi:periplasmic protein TonB